MGQDYLLLTGLVLGPVTTDLMEQVVTALKGGRYTDLARLPGELAGCLVTPQRIFLFRSVDSNEGLLYRRDGARVRWSTDPADLLDHGRAEFDRETLWRVCRRDSISVFRNLVPVHRGELVILESHATTTMLYDRITPLELPRRTSLADYAELAYDLILQAVRPYANNGRIGVLLSGGLDSTTVLTALAEVGADVVGYHMDTDDRLADESRYARAACEHLGVPFVPVPTDCGDGYLSKDWHFPQPYAHSGYRWMEQLAQRLHADGVTVAAWGSDGDVMFGPRRLGLHEVLRGDLTLREKTALCRGMVCSPWQLRRILASVFNSNSVLDARLTADTPGTDFLTPYPDVPDFVFQEEYVPNLHTLDLAVWRPRGIWLGSPLGGRELRRLVERMPQVYRLMPYQGLLIEKPVLRLILSTRLPALLWRRQGHVWPDSPHQKFVVTHPQVFADLLGGPDSHLVGFGVVDPARLARVLAEPALLRSNYVALTCSAMVELFLRDHSRRTRTDGTEIHNARAATS
ncbi:asparagine synthase [Nocardia colli]|uniref:Asparagine synthase n=1 Tax=Nocardia colli TaxID=2545717 RepID=A0A5N0EFJ8_9NOCA|nr:asparagine synthase C-terminal domain-containing protein [Nocardia colli]KAA8887713.1 asparagine synthase [Nocardia colli]